MNACYIWAACSLKNTTGGVCEKVKGLSQSAGAHCSCSSRRRSQPPCSCRTCNILSSICLQDSKKNRCDTVDLAKEPATGQQREQSVRLISCRKKASGIQQPSMDQGAPKQILQQPRALSSRFGRVTVLWQAPSLRHTFKQDYLSAFLLCGGCKSSSPAWPASSCPLSVP